MEKSNNKIIYIIVGIVLLIVAVPIVLALLGFLGGMFYYLQGTTN